MKKSDLGDVNAFGLDEFGQPTGLNPVWGAAVGTGLGTMTAIATRQFSPKLAKHSELVGFLAGGVASGAMIAFPGTRAAGWTGLASAFLNNGLRQLELMFFQPSLAEAAATNTVAPAASQGTQGVVIDRTHQVLGNSDMPRLVGATVGDASEHVQLVGGPALSQHGSHWGSTLFGSR